MKIIKNTCYGGYRLSAAAKVEVAKRKGKELYFFNIHKEPITIEEASKALLALAYTVPNPYEYNIDKRGADGTYEEANKIADSIKIDFDDRTDPDCVAVVEEMGEKASSRFSQLVVVEIPDGIEWEIDEYDGIETIREVSRTW